MSDETVVHQSEFKGGAGGRVVISGCLEITLADGTVDKRPFVANLPIPDSEEDPNG